MNDREASVFADLARLGAVGAAAGGGVTRTAWSPELFAAYDWLMERMRDVGLEPEVDAAGNLLGRWNVGEGAPILVGSHVDTVPIGGRFDGALGVVGGLHAIRMLAEAGMTPRRPVWLAAFMDEEGARFGTALFGSRAFAGEDLSDLGERCDGHGVTLREAMRAAGRDLDRVAEARRIDEIGGYLELHIEQGPVLEHEGAEIGVVTSIVGLRGFRATLTGEANHAGTTPMPLRRDAFAGAARATLALREEALRHGDMTSNVGSVAVLPGGSNVVPGSVEFTIDVRSATAEGCAALEPLVHETVNRIADEEQLELALRLEFALHPLELDPRLVDAVESAAIAAGARTRRLPSGAGHDAMVIGRHVPAAMIFVPSRRGISHSPEEYTSPEHCELGARVLSDVLAGLLSEL